MTVHHHTYLIRPCKAKQLITTYINIFPFIPPEISFRFFPYFFIPFLTGHGRFKLTFSFIHPSGGGLLLTFVGWIVMIKTANKVALSVV